MGKKLARFFGVLFILGAAIGAGTIGVAVLSSAAATVITVNDASDPASPVPASNCSPEHRNRLHPAGGAGGSHIPESSRHHQPPESPRGPEQSRAPTTQSNANVGELDVTDTGGTVTIAGAGASVVDIRAGCVSGCTNNTRVLEIGSGVLGGISANISGVTISNGNAPSRARERLWRHLCQQQRQSADADELGRVGQHGNHLRWRHRAVPRRIGHLEERHRSPAIRSLAAGGGGGGIYVVSNDTTSVSNLTIRNTTISGNQVDAGSAAWRRNRRLQHFRLGCRRQRDDRHRPTRRSAATRSPVAGAGSGIAASDGNWTVTNSTISGNNNAGTPVDGGGAFIANAASGTALNSTWNFDTIAGNSAGTTGQGGNLNVQSGSALNLGESIVAGGVAGSAPIELLSGVRWIPSGTT